MGLAIARRRLDSAAMSGQTDKHCISFRPMTAQTSLPDRKPRGPNAERRAATREKIMAAAVRRLYERGYAGATTPEIAKAAGVARGSLLHQFPTKVDLMLEVVRHASGYDENASRVPRSRDPDKRTAFMSMTDSTWRVITKPPAMAKLEIMIAARSDPALAERLPDIIQAIEERRHDNVWEVAEAAGIKDREQVDAMVTLHMAAMRGLAIELMFTQDQAQVDRAYDLLKRYKTWLMDALIKVTGAD